MATPRLARSPACLSCLRRLAQPASLSPISWTQTRARTTKAELEDLQGIPVRLLRDIPTFGRKHAIIRVKAGRMRNIWFPKGAAEYMTRQRFTELGLSEAAIGVRDRTFGTQLILEEEEQGTQTPSQGTQTPSQGTQTPSQAKTKRKDVLALPAEETHTLLTTLLPEVLVFPRTAVSTPPPEPSAPRSPSLAANAATSTPVSEAAKSVTVTPIFGSVSRNDIVALIKERLLESPQGSRVTLEVESVEIMGLDPEHDGENRIKRLGTFEVLIALGVDSNGREIEPVRRIVQVVAEET
ncbi:hypothetical protein FHL15_000270 [Xylaria flabelliformis]|uniref:Ribosomal protein L9 domain-containing protein n=1 Tax=Xylaria flabelliformis TaxID=2512241 RepID=A0A553IFE7_9PEZI|nr:hypothetical protein FHL15_000270 [Xylaria flabelliformis]